MSDIDEAEIKRIADRIILVCESAFSAGKEYVLLSRLGVDLGQDVQKLKYITGRGLADFVRTFPGLKIYSLVTVAGTTNILAVVRDSDVRISGSALPTTVATQPSEARYHYRFWAAFSVPPTEGKRRYFDPENFIFKDDFSETNEAPAGWLPVEAEFIAPEQVNHRDQVIKENIERWLDKHSYDRGQFLHNAKPSSTPQRNLLSAVIEALDRRQLQATNLSLDVIATLAAKKF